MVETRLLNGGINTDDAPSLMAANELLNAVNVRTNNSSTQDSQAVQFIEGNVEIQAVTTLLAFDPAEGKQSYELIGKTADETTGCVYLFLCHVKAVPPAGGLKHCIVKYDPNNDTAVKLLTNQMVGGALAWTADLFVDCGIADNKLFWVDPIPRYLDLTINYATDYTAPFSEAIISLITEPGYVPLIVESQTDATVPINTIQNVPTQYTYRFRNRSGFTSVLSPYSLTNLPQRKETLDVNPLAGNAIKLTMPLTQVIPVDWEQIELVVRYTDGNQFYVIKQFNRNNPIDYSQVELHIAGAQPLYFSGWSGTTLYTLDSNTIGKQFDSVPLSAKSLALMTNRLFLAGITEGYDTPVQPPSVTVTQNTVTVNGPESYQVQTYLLLCREKTTDNHYFAVIYLDDQTVGVDPVYRLLPYDFSTGVINSYTNTVFNPVSSSVPGLIKKGIFLPGVTVDYNECFTLDAQDDLKLSALGSTAISSQVAHARWRAVQEANNVTFEQDINWNFVFKYYPIVITKPTEQSQKVFLPNNIYTLGIDWYDESLRKSGSLKLQDVNIPPFYAYPSYGDFVTSLSVQIANTVPPPSFAKKFALTISKSSKYALFQFVPGIIKVASKNKDGVFVYTGFGQKIPFGYTYYATAIPLANLSRYGYGYAYQKGDYIELSNYLFYSTVLTYSVIGAQDGFLLVDYVTKENLIYNENYSLIGVDANTATIKYAGNPSGITTFYSVDTFNPLSVVTVYRQQSGREAAYEVAAFGEIVNGLYSNFYNQVNPTTAVIQGDYYAQPRSSETGSRTCFSYTTNEQTALVECNNLGRIAPVDNIGQQAIPTGFRWSNTNKIGAASSGYASFDYADFASVDITAGNITKLLPITKGVAEGGQLLILCESNSFTAFVGKSQLFGADQTQAAVTSTSQTIGDINPITGGWGCQSPRTAVYYKGLAFFADVRNRVVVQFGGNGAIPVSRNKASRLFKKLFSQVANASKLYGSINPYTFEYMICVPATDPTTKPLLPTTTLPNPLDAYYNDTRTYIFDFENNKWKGSWENSNEMIQVGFKVYGWNGKLWKEFEGAAGVYNGVSKNAMIVVPYTDNYPVVKRPMSTTLDCSLAPTQTWVVADSMVATAGSYTLRESDLMAEIMKNRLTDNASTPQEYDNNNLKGDRLVGKTPKIVLIWSADFHCVSSTLVWQPSAGHNTNKQ